MRSADAKSERHPFRELRTRRRCRGNYEQGSSLKLQPQPFKILHIVASRPATDHPAALRDHVGRATLSSTSIWHQTRPCKQIQGQFSTMTQSVRGSSQPCHAADIGSLAKASQGRCGSLIPQVSKRKEPRKHKDSTIIGLSDPHTSRTRRWMALGAVVC